MSNSANKDPTAPPWFEGNDQEWLQYKSASQEAQSMHQPGEKNNVQRLNELYTNIQFVCDEPACHLTNTRLFRVCVTVEGQTYEGMANNKKTAKLAAANAAMEGLSVSGLLQAKEAEFEAKRASRDDRQREVIKRLKETGRLGNNANYPPKKPIEDRNFLGPINPCIRLNEYHHGAQYKIVGQMGEYPHITFTVQCVVNGISYMGSGKNKRDGKYNSAEKAMRSLGLWTQEDEENKHYRDTHDGKCPPPPPRPRPPPKSQQQAPPNTNKQYGFKKDNQGGTKWGGGGAKNWGAGGGGRAFGTGGGNNTNKGNFGSAKAGFNRLGGGGGGGVAGKSNNPKTFKSVLSNQWTAFKSGGTLGDRSTFQDGARRGYAGGAGAKKITGGTQSLTQQQTQQSYAQPQSYTQQDFTSDNYSFNTGTTATNTTDAYSYGYGTAAPAQDTYYTSGYGAGSYESTAAASYGTSYGYADQYQGTGEVNQYAQQY